MKNKNSKLDSYMKYWFGISGPLDEYKRQQMNQIGNHAFFVFFMGMTTALLISFVIASLLGTRIAYYFVAISFLLLLLYANNYVYTTSRKVKLTDNEIEAKDLPKAKKTAWTRGMISGLLWGILMGLIEIPINHASRSSVWLDIFLFLIVGLIFGVVISLAYVNRIKVIKDDE